MPEQGHQVIATQDELNTLLRVEMAWKKRVNDAYKQKALLYHPDKSGHNQPEAGTKLFNRATNARTLLLKINMAADLGKRHLPKQVGTSSSSSGNGESYAPGHQLFQNSTQEFPCIGSEGRMHGNPTREGEVSNLAQ